MNTTGARQTATTMGILTDANNQNISDELAWNRYKSYLASIRDQLSPSACEFAEASWHYDHNDHRCLHDSWVERVLISEPAQGTRREHRRVEIQVKLLLAYHDWYLTLKYGNVAEYRMGCPKRHENTEVDQLGHGDWLVDEIGLSHRGLMTHEVCFSSGALWYIECQDFGYEWIAAKRLPG